ncbi:hypothetical protein [Flavobacterium sp.]|uniref:hypothetical protein n=1 Tax=Flavobacterium sp. TaxID=239 RepID=UPI00375150B1
MENIINEFKNFLAGFEDIDFLCEKCLEKMELPKPQNLFYEDTGYCLRCRNCTEVSNLHINKWLFDRGITLEPNTNYHEIRNIIPYTRSL